MKLERDESVEDGASDGDLPIHALGRALGLDPDLIEKLIDKIQGGKLPQNEMKWLIDLETDDPKAIRISAILLNEMGKLEEAKRLLRRGIDIDPNSARLWSQLGNFLFSGDDLHESRICFERALEIDSQEVGSLLGLAMICSKEGLNDGAIAYIDKASELAPKNHLVWFARAIVLRAIQDPIDRYDEAIASLKEALKHEPKLGSAWALMGEVYIDMREYSKAALALKKATRLMPGDPESWYLRGHAQRMLKRYKNALRYIDKALELDFRHAMAWEEKSILLKAMGRENEAMKAFFIAKQLEERISETVKRPSER
ncbi:MAG: tetratricopeptide repeat protein [Methanotrichaceae archaeon]|nr:tetratricopeptide repeat protein [Methanotrichaceae archaeon]